MGPTGNGRSLKFNGRRQPSFDGTSRMMREYQVRICERLGVKFPGPTRQSRRFDAPPATQNPTFWLMHCLWFSFRGHLLASAKANLLLRERGIPTARGNGKWSAVQVAGVLERL